MRGAYSDYMQATGFSNLRRMLAFARFALGATLAALRGPRPDVIYATSPPLTMALPALVAAARWRAPLVFEVRDLWPEAPIQMGALRNRARAAARAGPRALRVLPERPPDRPIARHPRGASAGQDPTLVPNSADLDLFDPSPSGGPFLVSYFGAMGEANDLTAAVEAARLLPGVRFVLMGDGKRRSELERAAPSNVEFRRGDEGRRGAARRRVDRLPHALQGRAGAGHELAQQALRHLRRRPRGDREHGRLDARAGGAERGRALRARRRRARSRREGRLAARPPGGRRADGPQREGARRGRVRA